MARKERRELADVVILPIELPIEAGARFGLRLAKPLETMKIEVLFGDEPAKDLILHAPDRIYGRAPKAEEGSQDLIIRSGKKILLEAKNVVRRSKSPESYKPQKPTKPKKLKSPIPDSEKDPFQAGPASNWWMLHQDLQHTSNARSASFKTLNPFWQSEFSGFFDITQPIFAPGLVLIGCGFGGDVAFAALDFNNGDPVWIRWKADNGNRFILGTPVAIDGRVFFVEESVDNLPAQVTCLDIPTGDEIWTRLLQVSWSHTSLASAFGMVYGVSRSGEVIALDAETGAPRWQQPVNVGVGSALSSPAVMFGSVYVGSEVGLHAINAINGDLGWVASTPSNWTASPAVITAVSVGKPAVVAIGGNDTKLRAYDAVYGQPLWEYPGDTSLCCTTPSSSEDGKVYLKQWKTVVALDVQTGNVAQTSPNFGVNVWTAPTITRDNALVVIDADQGHKLLLLNRGTLEILDEAMIDRVHAGDHGSPSVLGDYVFICDSRINEDGSIVASVRCFKGLM
jgi:outer membrane protein assembly factor BamB